MTPVAPPRRRRIVALTTDFGREGHHAGVLHGVLLGACPAARVVDLTHGIPPGDVAAAAWALRWSWRHFPAGTVHCVVIDPGVGSARAAIAVAADGQALVGPDNGVLSHALADARRVTGAVTLPPPPPGTPATFHGRDLFAPAAARLACGTPLARLGRPLRAWQRLPDPLARRTGPRSLEGEVVAVDRWGNLVTSLSAGHLKEAGISPDALELRIGRRTLRGLGGFYAEGRPGRPIALLNSNGHVEVAVNGGSAAELLRAGRGTRIRVSAGRP